MPAERIASKLSRELRDRVLARFGFEGPPPPGLGGLQALYRAWCRNIPFDNVRKVIALRAGDGRPLPGRHAQEFFEHWLVHGAGGTCWPGSNALFELLHACGFQARRVAGCMHDLGVVNHASTIVHVDGAEWLADSSLLNDAPLPLGDAVFIQSDPVFAAEIEPDAGAHVVWFNTPPNSSPLPCRISHDAVEQGFYVARYEASRESSVFNQGLYVRWNRPGELCVLVGATRFSRTARGLGRRDLGAGEVLRTLCEDVGMSSALIDEWVGSGALAALSEPHAGHTSPPVSRKPPSQR